MKRFLFCFWLFAAPLFAVLLPPALAAPPGLVVILLPGTSLEDWQNADAPNLHRLMQTGAIAVMNTRTAHHAGQQDRAAPEAALLTLGAGSRAAGAGPADGFLPPSTPAAGVTLRGTVVTAGALYTRRTGLTPEPGRSVCLTWPAAAHASTGLGYDLRLGCLADTLSAAGITPESGGGPSADWVAADSRGTVRRAFRLHVAPGACIIWDAGPDAAAADPLISAAAAQCAAARSRLLVLSPYSGSAAQTQNERLTPVLLWGSGIPTGLLWSPSTRRAGLVTDTDFAPSVAACFGVPRSAFLPPPFGFAWIAQAAPNGAGHAAQISRDAVQQAQGMTLLPYLALALAVWIVAATFAARRLPSAAWAFVPPAVLSAALFSASAPWFWILLPTLLALLLILARFTGPALAVWAAAMTLALLADMTTGSHWMTRSLLGYSALEGARYYGIGNEAMGLLLGASLVAAARLWPLGKAVQALLSLLMAILVVLLGTAGAKAGGVLVSLAVIGTFGYTVSGRRWNGRTALGLGGVVAGGMALAALADTLLPGTRSHIGEAVDRIASGGLGEAWDIVQRKLATEGHLAYHSAWAALLWLGIGCTGLLWKQATAQGPERALRFAGAVGTLACLLFNDAGVVAAALFVAVLWCAAVTQKSLPASEGSEAGRL